VRVAILALASACVMSEKFALKFNRNAGKMRLFDGIKPGINAAISPLKISVAGLY
jgi:hypothetical protein